MRPSTLIWIKGYFLLEQSFILYTFHLLAPAYHGIFCFFFSLMLQNETFGFKLFTAVAYIYRLWACDETKWFLKRTWRSHTSTVLTSKKLREQGGTRPQKVSILLCVRVNVTWSSWCSFSSLSYSLVSPSICFFITSASDWEFFKAGEDTNPYYF